MNNMFDLYHNWWNGQHDALFAMERLGFNINAERLDESRWKAEAHITEYDEALVGWLASGLNADSNKELGAFLYDELGLPIPPYCGSNLGAVRLNREKKRSVDFVSRDWLQKHPGTTPDQREGLKLLSGRAKAVKMSQFLVALTGHLREGRLHTTLGPNAETGRLSSRFPNLQQIPKRGDQYNIRKSFIADPGMKLVVIDYSQLELYLLAHFLISMYNDYTLAEDLQSGDVHTSTAKRCGVTRDGAKAVNYGIIYGKTGAGLGASLTDGNGVRIGKSAGQRIINDYLEGYPGIRQFMEDCIKEGKATGRVTTLLGRYRTLNWTYENSTKRKCANSRIQGSAADIVTTAMMRCFKDKELGDLGTQLLLQVHDELIFQCPENEAPAVLERASELMKNPLRNYEMKIPLEVDGKVADNWLEAK